MTSNGSNGSQRALPLPGLGRRLTKAEIAEAASEALRRLGDAAPPRRLDPLDAPRRAVARATVVTITTGRVMLVCGHEVEVYDVTALVVRCIECQNKEGRS